MVAAMRRLSMRKIREVLRLHHECGCQHRQIALACEMSPLDGLRLSGPRRAR